MGKDTVFLYAIAAVAVCFALVNALLLLVKRGKTAQTIGTISSIKMPNAETAKARNSKWAEIHTLWTERLIVQKIVFKYQWHHRLGIRLLCAMIWNTRKNCIVFLLPGSSLHFWSPLFVYWPHFSN